MPYHLGEVRAAMRKIMAACPDVKLENWADYGFRLDGYKRDDQGNTIVSTIRTVFQPARRENGQPEIIADVDALIKEWECLMPHYLIVDVEASGLFTYRDAEGKGVAADAPGQPRVAQIGMIHVDHKFEVEAEHEFLIRPEGWEMSEEAARVTGLTTDFLKANGGPITEALALYNAGIDARRVIVGHNIEYDTKALRAENRRAGLDDRYMQTRTICTMRASTELCKIPPPSGRGGYKWPKLSEACVFFGIEQGSDHTALADARNTLAILLKLVERGALPEPKSPYDKKPKKAKAPKTPKVGLPGDDPELDDAQAEIPI